jgi:hypothetical protein|tara:strand:- start:266 stop:430 length:165 start_codon:yes stop_codon:yes gene_type:complete
MILGFTTGQVRKQEAAGTGFLKSGRRLPLKRGSLQPNVLTDDGIDVIPTVIDVG